MGGVDNSNISNVNGNDSILSRQSILSNPTTKVKTSQYDIINPDYTFNISSNDNVKELNDKIISQEFKINQSVSDIKEQFRIAKKENDKLIRNANLKLTQLMEQGDQVIKSTWSSWQWGANYFYNNWNDVYKGHGNKQSDVLYSRESKFTIPPITSNSYLYGTTNVKNIWETPTVMPINASITPKSIIKSSLPISLTIVSTPDKPVLNLSVNPPEAVKIATPILPEIDVKLPEPNANPFRNFQFTGSSKESVRETRKVDNYEKSFNNEEYNGDEYNVNYIFYLNSSENSHKPITVTDFTVITREAKDDPKAVGQIAIHTVSNVVLENVKGYVKGKGNFISMETWHGGTVTLKDKVSLSMENGDNTVFYIYPTTYHTINRIDYGARKQKGGIEGKLDVSITGRKNNIYLITGVTGSFDFVSSGQYTIEGAGNIVYSGMGYSPDYYNLAGKNGGNGIEPIPYKNGIQESNKMSSSKDWKPTIQLSTAPVSYGDSNIILFFSDRPSGIENIAVWPGKSNTDDWRKSAIGIYQGEIEARARIGEQLAIDSSATSQTESGNTKNEDEDGNIEYGNDKYVEENVGIFATSGQRTGITPSKDLGAPNFYDNDLIHSLQVNVVDITFGKHSKDGVMMLSKNGTVLNAVMPTNSRERITEQSTEIKDYNGSLPVASADDTTNEAATGTIIALATGKWSDSATNMSSMSSDTTDVLKNEKSEINIGKDVFLTAKYADINSKKSYPIAYAATGGIINAYGNTTATGYGSIIGYASDGGEVTAYGNVTAIDSNVASDTATNLMRYQNIGAYSTGNGSVVSLGNSSAGSVTVKDVNGKVSQQATINTVATTSNIYGTGAIAENGGTVNLNGVTNINTGTSGALIALTGGVVNYAGGTINNTDISSITGATSNTHENVTPIYVDSTSGNSRINITGSAKINISDGVLINGSAEDYVFTDYDNSSTDEKNKGNYFGMQDVDVEITGNGVNLGIISGANLRWDGTPNTYLDSINVEITKFNSLTNSGNYTYKSSLVNGSLQITGSLDINLNDTKDQFNNIIMESELVTIDNGVTIYGENKSLAMGSNSTAKSNASSGYVNKGDIIATTTTNSGIAGLSVSYGTIDNQGTVTINKGAGLYGTNGSKLENSGDINVNTSGYGIVGLGTGITKQSYGTDDMTSTTLGSTKTVEIINSGIINVSGDKAIAIYAENNTGAPIANVTIDNSSDLIVGDNGVGIALISTAPTTVNHGTSELGGTITVTSTGNASDIETGIKGIGIYAEDSSINLSGTTPYIIETKDEGVGIYASGNTITNSGDLEYVYSGSSDKSGIGIVYDTGTNTNNISVILNNSTNTTVGMVGIYNTATSGTFTNTGDITGNSTSKEFGIVVNGADVVNNGDINLANAIIQTDANVGIYSKADNTITNTGNIIVGDNALGIYGYKINHSAGNIIVGDNGIAIYSQGTGSVTNDVIINSNITVGDNQAVAVYSVGITQDIVSTNSSSFNIGKDSFGFVDVGLGNKITSNTTSVTLSDDGVYIYQNDDTGFIENNTNITSTGNRNYGIYSNGTVTNSGDIDFSNGDGNVAIYSTGGTSTNYGTIKVGSTDLSNELYSLGMATGYYDKATGTISNEGIIINRGTIEVSNPNTIGMYAVGNNSKAINYGTINLTGNDTIGMYLDQGALGENWGTIQTTATGLTGVKGIYVANGSYIKNYGTINISATDDKSADIWAVNATTGSIEENATGINPITGATQTGSATVKNVNSSATDGKVFGGVTISTTPKPVKVTLNATGEEVEIVKVDTDIISAQPNEVHVVSPSNGTTVLNVHDIGADKIASSSEANSLGMYVDTSGVNYTNPINGLNNIVGLSEINLLFGVEATRYTDAKAIEVGSNILNPYNSALQSLGMGATVNVTSGSLTWAAQPIQSSTSSSLDAVYLVKTPYQYLAEDGDDQTYIFLSQLEQRYGVDTYDKVVFNKLNSIGKAEVHIFTQASDEMKGHQYANTQRRVYETGAILDKEFNYLRSEWGNPTKDSNKIKVFGSKNEYRTDTAGVVDYKNDAYGVAYVHENETIKLGNSSGWYAGYVFNRYDFKDIGKSREDQHMVKAGVFKEIGFDDNGSLRWNISGDVFVGRNEMDRKFFVVDEVFGAKADYMTYGVGITNKLSKDIRLTENTRIIPYGSLKLEYGRYENIKEDRGIMRLEVKGDDYYSVKPEVGVEFKYTQNIFLNTRFVAGLGVAYENELGKLGNVENKVKLSGSSTDPEYYQLRGDKEDRRGNFKTDFKFGIENRKFGLTFNTGYDTKGDNLRLGLGLRAIF